MKKKLLTLLLATSLVFAGCSNKATDDKTKEEEANNSTPKQEESFYVKVGPPIKMDLEKSISLPGTLTPYKEAIISPKVNGNAQSIFVEVGDKVSAGQSLLKLDDTFFALQFNKAESGIRTQNLNLEKQKRDLERSRVLFENGGVSQSDYEALENAYKIQEELLTSIKIDYQTTSKNLEYTNVTSPISGIVSFKDVLLGQNVGPGSEIFKIVNLDSLYVETSVSEIDLPLLKVGQNVRIMSSNSNTLQGKVESIGPIPNSENKSYPVKILVKNEDNSLKPGMFLSVDIISDIHKDTLAISKSALTKVGDKSYVFVVNGDKSYMKEVTTGYENKDMVEILSGIVLEDQIVISGKENLKDESNIIISQ